MRERNYLFVNTHFAPDYHYGGVVSSGEKLYKYLRTLGRFHIATVSRNPRSVRKFLTDEDNCYKSVLFHRFGLSFGAIFGLWKTIHKCDALLINGIFTFPVTLAQLYSILLRKPFIVAVRGGLEPVMVAQKKWKKYLYIKCITLPLMKQAKFIHVTSQEEEKTLRNLGFSNLINISNGIDREEFEYLPEKCSIDIKYRGKFIFLFLSRTDKEKGVDILIQAYRRFCTEFYRNGHVLLLVGPDNQGYLKKMLIKYDKENIEYISGVYGNEKIKLIRNSDVLVMPSYSENFGNIIAEALACERPVVTTDRTPWAEIERIGCGLYIKPNETELFEAMKKMYLKSPLDLAEMGKKGRKYIFENFNWGSKAQDLYRYLEKLTHEE